MVAWFCFESGTTFGVLLGVEESSAQGRPGAFDVVEKLS
jgi:hypothetical protein